MNKFSIPQLRRSLRAFTLIEIAIVISIITLLALGIAQSATYFRAAANKSLCIVVQKQVQDAMRSIENLNNIDVGADDSGNLTSEIMGTSSSFFPVSPTCPGGGTFTFATAITPVGSAFAICSLATTSGHAPTPTQLSSW